ncbi:MAG: hypothetical protein RID91_16115 [Azospirillaceae bacterium]
MRDLRADGWSVRAIAARLARDESVVKYHLDDRYAARKRSVDRERSRTARASRADDAPRTEIVDTTTGLSGYALLDALDGAPASPPTSRARPAPAPRKPAERVPRGRPVTDAERADMRVLRAQGYSLREIARLSNRSQACVHYHVDPGFAEVKRYAEADRKRRVRSAERAERVRREARP